MNPLKVNSVSVFLCQRFPRDITHLKVDTLLTSIYFKNWLCIDFTSLNVGPYELLTTSLDDKADGFEPLIT